jgi:hypothetical protein
MKKLLYTFLILLILLLFLEKVKGGSTSNVSKFIILTVKKGT